MSSIIPSPGYITQNSGTGYQVTVNTFGATTDNRFLEIKVNDGDRIVSLFDDLILNTKLVTSGGLILLINDGGGDVNATFPTGTSTLSSVSGVETLTNKTFGNSVKYATDTLSGAGAVSVTSAITKLTTTGVAQALTLADGTNGQIKTIIHDVDGGSAILTPTTKTGFTTITFTNVGETVTLVFVTARGWMVSSIFGAVAV